MLFVLVVLVISAAAVTNRNPLSNVEAVAGAVEPLDELWVLVSAALVFFMQAGFLCFEVGLARQAHATAVAIKNIVDWAISSLAFVTVGFALMFGTSAGGIVGGSFFGLSGVYDAATTVSGPTFFVFQLAFAGTAITLVSGSLVERTTLLAYGGIALALGLVIYPVYGHWVWGNLLIADNEPWLASLGFHDFAGGTVVHLLGATVAYVGISMIGPRIGRFDSNGEAKEMPASNIGLALLGVIILWFGWWGFNGGSYLEFGRSGVVAIILTNVAAVCGFVGAGLYAYLVQHRFMMTTKLVAGAVGGLVAITPGVDVVNMVGAVAIGLIAGIAVSWSHDVLLQNGIDDALGVIPVHGVAAVVGTVLLAPFSVSGTFEGGALSQTIVQVFGVMVCIGWAAGASFPVYWIIKQVVGLRVNPATELAGAELDDNTWPYGIAAFGDEESFDDLVGADS